MAYRYTDTEKWKDAWFCGLKPMEKLLFDYLCDNCDIAGFIEYIPKKWADDIGADAEEIKAALKGLERGLKASSDGLVYFLRTFLKHQKNLPINPSNKAHQGILKRFDKYAHYFDIQDVNKFVNENNNSKNKPLERGTGNGNGNGIGNDIGISIGNSIVGREKLFFKDVFELFNGKRYFEMDDDFKSIMTEFEFKKYVSFVGVFKKFEDNLHGFEFVGIKSFKEHLSGYSDDNLRKAVDKMFALGLRRGMILWARILDCIQMVTEIKKTNTAPSKIGGGNYHEV